MLTILTVAVALSRTSLSCMAKVAYEISQVRRVISTNLDNMNGILAKVVEMIFAFDDECLDGIKSDNDIGLTMMSMVSRRAVNRLTFFFLLIERPFLLYAEGSLLL